jgi:ferritin-like metal-binding protein YciE
MTSKDTTEAINSYVTDMLALEKHIAQALEGQLEDLKNYPTVTAELRSILATIGGHVNTLEMAASGKGGQGPADAIKKVGSKLLGFGAAAIDMVRNEGMPKNLRDDYTACSLATIGYVMLHTTALSLNDRGTAEIARRHLDDYAQVVMRLHNIIPAAVVKFLQEEGLPANESALSEVSNNLEGVWRGKSQSIPDADQVNISSTSGRGTSGTSRF